MLFAGFLVLCAVAASALTISLHHRSNINAAAPYHPATHAVVFIVSGYSSRDLSGTDLATISSLRSTGVEYDNAWSGEFPTAPATLAASISTGAFPRRDGLLGNQWEDQQTHQILAPTTNIQTLTGSMDQILEPSGISSLASLLKSARPSDRVLSVGGSNCAAASAIATWVADYVLCASRARDVWGPIAVAGHALPAGTLGPGDEVHASHGPGLAPRVEGWRLGAQDDWVARTAVLAMQRVHPALTFVEFPEPDAVGPYAAVGDRARVMHALLRGIDRDMGRVVGETRRLGTATDTVFVLVSAHGFDRIATTVSPAKLRSAAVAVGTAPAYLWGDGSPLLGIVDPGQTQAAAGVIESERIASVDAAYYKSHDTYVAQYINPDMSVKLAEAQSYLVNTTASSASAQIVTALAPHASLRGGRAGGLPKTSSSVGLQWGAQQGYLLIAGHGTYRGQFSTFPARLVDVAPTLEALLGLAPVKQDGDVLADATFRPPVGATKHQNQVKPRWEGYVAALRSWERRSGS